MITPPRTHSHTKSDCNPKPPQYASHHSFQECLTLFISDWTRYISKGEHVKSIADFLVNVLLAKDHRLAFSFWLRFASCSNVVVRYISKIMHFRFVRRYGLQIDPRTDIGPGFYMVHGIAIVINYYSHIGANAHISQFLTIGSNKGTPAIIGDNVYIGPGVSIVEDVKIGNNVKIGAGTTVIHDVPDNATTVGFGNRIIMQ